MFQSLRAARSIGAGLILSMASFAAGAESHSKPPREGLTFAGTVEINSTQFAFIASGQVGGGILEFQGKEYEFTVGGLGIGVQTMSAVGAVYNLDKPEDFAGVYSQARIGATLGKGQSVLELANTKGVHMSLRASNTGAALSLGGDGMVITLK